MVLCCRVNNGELVLTSPFSANELGMQGIYIFNVKTVEEAKSSNRV